MVRIFKVAFITILLAGGVFGCVLWLQWADQTKNVRSIPDVRTDEQKARVRFGRDEQAVAKIQAERERKREQAKTDRIKYDVADMLASDAKKPLSFATLKLLVDSQYRNRTVVYGSSIRQANEPYEERNDPLRAIRRSSRKFAQPTLSRFAVSSLSPSTPSHPASGKQLIAMLSDYRKLGIKHFRETSLSGLTRTQTDRVADFMESVVDLMFRAEAKEEWFVFLDQAKQLAQEYPPLASDALFLYVTGMIESECGDYLAANETLRLATKLFSESHYPARDVVLAYQFLLDAVGQIGLNQKDNPLRCDYALAVHHWLAEDYRATPDRRISVLYSLNHFLARNISYPGITDPVLRKINRLDHLPRALLSTAQAIYLDRTNRRLRSFHQKSEEVIDRIKNNQKKAEFYCEDALRFDPNNYQVASLAMETLQHSDQHDQVTKYFEQAIASRPDFYGAYWSYMKYLLAEKKSTYKELIDFARTYAKTQSDGRLVHPWVLTQCYFLIRTYAPYESEERKLLQDEAFIADVVQAIDALIAQNDSLVIDDSIFEANYLPTMKALVASHAGDMRTAHRTWRDLDDQYSQKAANRFGVNSTFDVMRCESYALSTEFEAEARELKQLLGDGPKDRLQNADQIIKLTEVVTGEISNEVGRKYFDRVRQQVTLERDFDQGKTISLPFDPSLLLWRSCDIAQIKPVTKTSAKIDNRIGVQSCNLNSIVSVPGDKTVEFEITCPDKAPRRSRDILSPSLVVCKHGNAWMTTGVARNMAVPFNEPLINGRKMATSGILTGYVESYRVGNFFRIESPSNKVNYKIHVGVNYLEVYTDGRFRFRMKFWGDEETMPDIVFNLRQPFALAGRGVATVSNIQISKWAEGPPPIDEFNDAGLIKYYAKQVKQTPTDPWSSFWLAMAYHQSGSFEVAIKHYRKAVKLGVPKQYAGFYVGDCYEQLGDTEKAIRFYRVSAKDDNPMLVVNPMMNSKSKTHPQNWAAFRVGWDALFSSDQETRESWDPAGYAPAFESRYSTIVQSIYFAQLHAVRGDFERAQKIATHVIQKCEPELLTRIEKYVNAYAEGKVYVEDPGETKLYNSIGSPVEFFHALEQY